MAEAEQQEDVGRPRPDALDRDERAMRLRRRHMGEGGEIEAAPGDRVGDRGQRPDLRAGKPATAQDRFAGRQRASAESGLSAASSRPKMALALATDTCCETMIAASPAKPGSRRRKRRRAADLDAAGRRDGVERSQRGGGLRERLLAIDEPAGFVAQRGRGLARRLAALGRVSAGSGRRLSSCPFAAWSLSSSPCRSSVSRPTPNGLLHLGHAYSALRNANSPRVSAAGCCCASRTPTRRRCRPEYEAAILDDLAWLGVACEPNPRRQSEHGGDYAAALARCAGAGLVYPCYCTRGQIARR